MDVETLVSEAEHELFLPKRLECKDECFYLGDKLVNPSPIGTPKEFGVYGCDFWYRMTVGRLSDEEMQKKFKNSLQDSYDSLKEDLKKKVNCYALFNFEEKHQRKREFVWDSMGMGGDEITQNYYYWKGIIQFYHSDLQ